MASKTAYSRKYRISLIDNSEFREVYHCVRVVGVKEEINFIILSIINAGASIV